MDAPSGWKAVFGSNGTRVVSVSDIAFVCPHCAVASTFKTITNYLDYSTETRLTRCHLVLQCNFQPCRKVTYVELSVSVNYYPPAESDFFLHPFPGVDIIHPAIPPNIAEDWSEAQRALAVGANKAAAVMARRVLYGVLLDQKCKEHPMHEGLKELSAKARLPMIFDQWLNAIKDDGHDAAHPHRALFVSTENVTETVEYVSELLRFVYAEPYDFQQRLERNKPVANGA